MQYKINELIKRIRSDPEVRSTNFNIKLLSMVGDICKVYGYGTARLFLLGKKGDDVKIILKVLRMIEKENVSTEVGALILKNLVNIVNPPLNL